LKSRFSLAFHAAIVLLSSAAIVCASDNKPPVDFCRAFANKAAEARLARQSRQLADVKAKIEEQLLVLEQKTTALGQWIEKRDRIRAAVSDGLVKMYANVEPDVAAQQLRKLDVETAAEVLQRLNPKVSGEILSAMDVNFAGRILQLMAKDAGKLAQMKDVP
jgi:flagellar motility protein MotE (MotC chaperone)